MTSSTAGSSKSLTPTELVETRNATLGLRLSVYATILGIFALLTPLVTILVSSFSSIGPTGLAAVRWSMLVSIWIYLATAVIDVIASVLMIGAPPRMKVKVVGLFYAVFAFLACVSSWLSLLGLPFASGFLGYSILLMQYPVWLMYVARAADFADSRQAKEQLKSAIGLACIGLTLWIGSIIQGAVMVQVSTWAATMGRMIKGSTLAHLLLIQGREYQTLKWGILTAATVLVSLLLMCAARFTHGVLKHILKSVVKGIVLASLFVLVTELIPQSPSPYVVYKPLVLAAFMLAAIIPLALAPLRAFRASLITLRALDGITRDAATGPDSSSAPQQSVTLYKRRPLLISLGLLASVAGVVILVYSLDRASGRRPQQYPSTIAALNDSIGSFNSSTPRRAGTFERSKARMPDNARLQQLDVVAGQLNNKIWLQVVSGDSLPSKIDVEQLEQLATMLNRGAAFNTIGVAQYRLGNYHAAIEACLKSLEFRSKEMRLPDPYAGDLAFLAMSHFQLGDKQEADKYRNQLAEAMQLDKFKDDKECLGFLEEANLLFSGTAVSEGVNSNTQTTNANSTSASSELTAQDRLAASTSLYKSIRTYRDNGLITHEMSIQGQRTKREMPFSTAFERGGRFRWQFRYSATPGATPDQLFAIWSADCKSFEASRVFYRESPTDRKLNMPLATANGISGGAAIALIPLLHIEKDGSYLGPMTTDLLKPEYDGIEEVDQVKCWKIKGKAKLGKIDVTLWIDGEGIIRKIYNEMVVDPARVFAGESFPSTPAFTKYTIITIKPVINEPKIDDSKFSQRKKIKGHAQQLGWSQRNSASNAKTLGARTASDGEFVFSTTVKASKDEASHDCRGRIRAEFDRLVRTAPQSNSFVPSQRRLKAESYPVEPSADVCKMPNTQLAR